MKKQEEKEANTRSISDQATSGHRWGSDTWGGGYLGGGVQRTLEMTFKKQKSLAEQ